MVKETIIKFDEDIINDIPAHKRNIGMVFQKPNPFPMSIYDNIAYGPRTHGITSRAKLDEIVENSLKGAAIWNEVKDNLKKSALSLSGGQQQRVAIARALAAQPPVILADEPTGNLDSASSKEILEILKNMHKQGKTVILITHDNGIAAQARRVVRIIDGKIESDFINENYGKEEYVKNQLDA